MGDRADRSDLIHARKVARGREMQEQWVEEEDR